METAVLMDIEALVSVVDAAAQIETVAYNRLNDWVNANGGSHHVGVPVGSFIDTILAFLKAILPMLGCVVAQQKKMVMNRPILARMILRGQARTYGGFADIGKAVEASMHLLTVSTEAEYTAFQALPA